MDNKPLQGFPQENEAIEAVRVSAERIQGEQPKERPNLIAKWIEFLPHLGLGESVLRIGTNVLTVLFVIFVVWVMQTLYPQTNLGLTGNAKAAGESTPLPSVNTALLPPQLAMAMDGISRYANLHTTIPSRPRLDVLQYTVQPGDSIFAIADQFGIKPSTILFANSQTLVDNVDYIKPGQILNILPEDGAYYQWTGTETLTGVAKYYGVDPEVIINSPANHLDPDTIGDLSHPNIPARTWLVVPGGSYSFVWRSPIGFSRTSSASARVTGAGACGVITTGAVGFGTFVFPTTEHWLSGTDYRPDVNHFGVDFAGSMGNAIYAVDAGVVVYAGWNDWGYGNLIVVDHGNGWQSLYGHLSQINVSCGQSVGQGDVIGLMGSTGHSTGPHLHFELSYKATHINPHTIYDIPAR
jgi:murein DD-endopeptidase MepM/ murein hydrolase activator NlpD